MAAAASNTFDQGGGAYSTPSKQVRAWLWRNGKITKRAVTQQMMAVATRKRSTVKRKASSASVKGNSFIAVGGNGLALRTKGRKWFKSSPGPSCAFFDVDTNGPRTLLAGWSGTYRLNKSGEALNAGPSSSVVWGDDSGRTIVINTVMGGELAMSRNSGRSWKRQKLVDSVGQGDCKGHPCNDDGEGARLDFAEITGTSSGDIWAFGYRADTPGGRVYRYAGNSTWERIPFPAEIFAASDAVVLEKGHPLVATGEGVWRAVTASTTPSR